MTSLLKVSNKACSLYAATVGKYSGHDIILCYHSVRDINRPIRGWLGSSRSLDSIVFDRQMSWLSSVAEVVSLSELLQRPRTGTRIRVAVTFDDGYFDNIDVAMPILRQYGIPITWFVATDFIDNADLVPWWDLIDLTLAECYEPVEFTVDGIKGIYDPTVVADRQWLNTRLRMILKSTGLLQRDAIIEDMRYAISRQYTLPTNSYAREEEIKSVLQGGDIELGGHTGSHPNVALCSSDELKAEINRGKIRLEKISGQSLNWFAYPFGGRGAFSPSAAKAVQEAGFNGACSLVSGTVSMKTEKYMIPRYAISPNMTMETFKARVLGAPLYAGLESLRSSISMSSVRKYGKGFVG
ncbi:hypothetical protein LP43_1786 [Methylophaga thiooxydans]|uniref:NodB homology domain-containing protein n=1 Tax=Methylophaga thiooxydans TaxID=392484 RepID=A0A0A0BHI3_9GAMM|nr:hypothetical protein LP43_1786 [Methylophaga thiooxydans]